MQKKTIIGIIVIIIFIIGLISIIVKDNNSDYSLTNATSSQSVRPYTGVITPTKPQGTATTTQTSITMADVMKHSTAGNCWTTISGNVYDLTSWIAKHPGGEEAIISLCGIDGTKPFLAQHGGQKKPENMLATFIIGSLKI